MAILTHQSKPLGSAQDENSTSSQMLRDEDEEIHLYLLILRLVVIVVFQFFFLGFAYARNGQKFIFFNVTNEELKCILQETNELSIKLVLSDKKITFACVKQCSAVS